MWTNVWTKSIQFCGVLLTAVALGAGLAHLFSMPNKLHMTAADYLIAQQLYRGWDLLGFVAGGALLATILLVFTLRRRPYSFVFSLMALLAIAGGLAVFFLVTYPANIATSNWTFLPPNWIELRVQWEYSHAAAAVLYLVALACLTLTALLEELPQPVVHRHFEEPEVIAHPVRH